MENFSCKTLRCVKDSTMFSEGNLYYCFADDGNIFWIHAPWLEETLGANQIKCPNFLRDNFVNLKD